MLATLSSGPPVPSASPAWFTLTGSDELEAHLDNICKHVLHGIRRCIPPNRLEGIALGGGYGRGEGGVLKTPVGDQPYNDLEFYIFVRGNSWANEHLYASALLDLCARLEPAAGVELEFKITSLEKLRRSPPSLFHHDLVVGHHWVLGDENLFSGCDHHRDAKKIPLSEATRLLMNRCSGLLFARDKLDGNCFDGHDADFVGRNLAKTELALGDAVLIAFGQYHWSCLERGHRLSELAEDLPWLEEVRQRHVAAVEFKLQPYRACVSADELREHFRELNALALEVWLWLEGRRLGCHFRSPMDYTSSPVNKWPEGKGWRNRLVNMKVFGPRALLVTGNGFHPRHQILSALVSLLWSRAGVLGVKEKVRRELLSPRGTPIIPAYRERWRQVS